MSNKTNKTKKMKIVIFASLMTDMVRTQVKPTFGLILKSGESESSIKKNLNDLVDYTYKTEPAQMIQKRFANKDIRQLIKDIFVHELEYEF